MSVKVGSRQSPLALAQTEEIVAKLRSHFPGRQFEVVPMSTGGDRNKDAPLISLGRGTFVKEIEAALLRGDIDVAVHSAKDLPASIAEGLVIAAFGQRRDALDVLVDRWDSPLDELPPGARIGTGSPRRISQLKAARPDIELLPIRGNVGTRLEKAAGNDYDGVVLAAAGLLRLGRGETASEYLAPEVCTPDAGQGALAVQARSDSSEIIELLSFVNHAPTSIAVRAERAFVSAIGGGCTAPIGAYGQVVAGRLDVMAMAAEPDGSRVIRVRESCDSGDPEAAGRLVADSLISAGAGELASWDGRR